MITFIFLKQISKSKKEKLKKQFENTAQTALTECKMKADLLVLYF